MFLNIAWRRYIGKVKRQKALTLRNQAVRKIQYVVRKWLKKLMAAKGVSACKIQKFWRIKLFLHASILQLRYRVRIADLHAGATVIQLRWRQWNMYRHSPLAGKYRRPLFELKSNVLIIETWWLYYCRQKKRNMKLQEVKVIGLNLESRCCEYYSKSMAWLFVAKYSQ